MGVEAKTNVEHKMRGVNLEGYHSTVKKAAVKKFLFAVQETFKRRWEHPGQPPAR